MYNPNQFQNNNSNNQLISDQLGYNQQFIQQDCSNNNQNSFNQLQNEGQTEQSKLVQYTDFASLPAYPQDTNLQSIAEQISIGLKSDQKKDWIKIFQSIDHIRILNKYYGKEINNIFQNYGMNLIDLYYKCLITPIQINILMFLKEVFQQAKHFPIMDQVIETFVPHLLKNTHSEKKVLKNEASDALTLFVQNCFKQDVSYIVACKCIYTQDKNKDLSEKAVVILGKLIQSGSSIFTSLQPNTLQIIMKTLTKTISHNRPTTVNYAQQICNFIGQLVGQENYLNLMQHVLSEDEKGKMMKCIVDHNQKSQQKMSKQKESFADIVKVQRSNFKCQQKNQQFNDNNNYTNGFNENSNSGMNINFTMNSNSNGNNALQNSNHYNIMNNNNVNNSNSNNQIINQGFNQNFNSSTQPPFQQQCQNQYYNGNRLF